MVLSRFIHKIFLDIYIMDIISDLDIYIMDFVTEEWFRYGYS